MGLWKGNKVILPVAGILAISFAYAVIRYVVLGPIEPTHIPVFVLNKSISLASVILMFRAALFHRANLDEGVRAWGTAALHGAYIHVLLSLSILSASYYPDFFDGEMMSLRGELVIGFGVLALYGFWLIRRNRSVWAMTKGLQAISALALAGHVFTRGYVGWLDVSAWHGGMPPISMISFLLATASLFIFTFSGAKKRSDGTTGVIDD
jgi:hypothetical protein